MGRFADTDVGEDFSRKPPIPGWKSTPIVSVRDALADLADYPDVEAVLDTAEAYFPDGTNEDKLSSEQARSIFVYTSNMKNSRDQVFHEKLNMSLRERSQRTNPYLHFAKLLQSSLMMLQIACDSILWRAIKEDLHDKFKDRIGKTMVFWGFTSTTKRMQVLDEFLPDTGGSILCFKLPSASPVARFSAYEHESEWLIPAGTSFKVNNVYKAKGRGTTMIDFSFVSSLLPVHAPAEVTPPIQPAPRPPANSSMTTASARAHEGGAHPANPFLSSSSTSMFHAKYLGSRRISPSTARATPARSHHLRPSLPRVLDESRRLHQWL